MSDRPPVGAEPGPGSVPLPPGYELVGRLGSGGFAAVWLAEQGRLGRKVAVKILTQSLVDDETERRFLAECRAIGRLSGHPSVVTVHDAGTTDGGHPYLVMEHLPGGSLQDRLRAVGPLPWAEVVTVGVHVADALAAAHAAGILHRDVKPANVLVDDAGAPRLGDFGIARLADGAQTATGILVGTIPYTPPEVLSGERVTPGADVWALGVTLHTLLTGTNPFLGDADESPAASIGRVLRCELPSLSPSVPAELRTLLDEMVAADPAQRPDGAAEVVRRLQGVQRSRGLPLTRAVTDRDDGSGGSSSGETTAGGLTPLPPVGGVDPDAPTVAGAGSSQAPPVSPVPVAPVGATEALPYPGPAVAPGLGPAAPGQAAPAPGQAPAVAGPVHPAPGEVPPGWQPPSAADSGRSSRGRGRLVAALAVLLVLVLGAGIVGALALRGDGDGDGDDSSPQDDDEVAADAAGDAGSSDTAGPPGDEIVDSPIGAPIEVPAGAASTPEPAWDLGEACRPPEDDCAVMGADGDLIVLHTRDGSRRLTRVASDSGEETASVEISGPTRGAGLARIGDVLIVSGSGSDDERVYRAMDPDDLALRWTLTIPGADGPVFPGAQLSDDVGVIMLRSGDHIVVDLATGEDRRETGRVVATDRQNVYAAVDDRIVARDLRTGDQAWETDIASSAPGPGVFPAWRHGVVRGATLIVTTEDGDLVGIGTEGGAEIWRQPLSGDDASLGRAIAVAASGDRVVVAAESGDLGVDPEDGTISWRVERDRLVLDPDLDEATISDVRGQPVWVGQQGVLVAGWAGVGVRAISTADGSEVATFDDFPPSEGGWGAGVVAGGAVLRSTDSVTALSTADLSTIWTIDAPDVTAAVPIDAGVVLLGPEGVQAFLA